MRFPSPLFACRRHSESAPLLAPLSPVAGGVPASAAMVSTAATAASCGTSVKASAATATAGSSAVPASARTSRGTGVIAPAAAARAPIISTTAVVASKASAAPRFRRAWRDDGLVQLERWSARTVISSARPFVARPSVASPGTLIRILATTRREALPAAATVAGRLLPLRLCRWTIAAGRKSLETSAVAAVLFATPRGWTAVVREIPLLTSPSASVSRVRGASACGRSKLCPAALITSITRRLCAAGAAARKMRSTVNAAGDIMIICSGTPVARRIVALRHGRPRRCAFRVARTGVF